MSISVTVADYALRTALGPDVESTWHGLTGNTCAIRDTDRFQQRAPNVVGPSATCPDIAYASTSMVMQMLAPLLDSLNGRLPPTSLLLLATTVGEIDQLEDAQIQGTDETRAGRIDGLLETVARQLKLTRPGSIVSCACASSSMALALGASLIRSGRETDVIVVACDAVSEFVLAGFHSLAALSPEPARPFDRNRQGLSVGEAAGWCWLRAGSAEPSRGQLLGWSCRADAHHMTAPAPQGRGLVDAIRRSLDLSGLDAAELGAICAHGTGTRYNDEMEMRAFAGQPGTAACPIFGIKGHIGHTMGAAGLAEAIVALEASRHGCIPPTAGCLEPEAAPIVRTRTAITKRAVLSTNSGFGGVNTALIVDAGTRSSVIPEKRMQPSIALAGLGWATHDELGFTHAAGSIRMPHPSMDNPDPFFEGGYRTWGRMTPAARQLVHPIELGLHQLHSDRAAREAAAWGIIGLNATGCHDDNRAFFRDYLDNGRTLARGGLFVHTLPSTPVAEASIHYGLRGPVFHLVDPHLDFSRAIDWACAMIGNGDATDLIVASLSETLVVCAFLRAGDAGTIGRAHDLVQAMPGATPSEWLSHIVGMKPALERNT